MESGHNAKKTLVSGEYRQRVEKLRAIRARGIDPYPRCFDRDTTAAEIKESFEQRAADEQSESSRTIAGRVMTIRMMGKASFFHLQDRSGLIQVYIKKDRIGQQQYDFFKYMIDCGDTVGVKGIIFKTRTGEITLRADEVTLLAKALRPLPEKWHGLKDVETRYRKRSVDLTVNADVRDIFIKRSRIISALREILVKRDFLEVETPVLQPIPGGAAARPFATHHRALDIDLFLRIAPELYLKRIIAGGMERIFEIGRCFRNEGIDAHHNPEFTILEAYQAFTDFRGMMELCEELITGSISAVAGDNTIQYRGKTVVCKRPFKQLDLDREIRHVTGADFGELFEGRRLRETAQHLGIAIDTTTSNNKIFDRIFDETILPRLDEPTFVVGYPKAVSPLAKSFPGKPHVVERFELFIAGEEIANAYSELNDPEEQRKRFEDQLELKKQGDDEASLPDAEFLEALEHGMPPAGGLGIGVDRLVMFLTGVSSIREVLFFPLLKPVK